MNDVTEQFVERPLDSVTDAFGATVTVGDFVVYAAKSWGMTRLRLGQVLKLSEVHRSRWGRPVRETRVFVVTQNGRRRSYKKTWTDMNKLVLYKKSDLTVIGD